MIRKAELSDIREIYDIDRLVLTSHWSEVQYLDEILNPLSFSYVIQANDSVVGFYILRAIEDTGDILQIAVSPNYQGQGFGTKLMSHLLKMARSIEVFNVLLEVEENNHRALSLYLAFGFENLSVRKGYYGQNRNAIVMRKVL